MDRADILNALQALSAALPEEGAVVYACAPDGRTLGFAGDVRRLTGRDPADLEGERSRWWSAVHADDREKAREALRDLAPGESRTVEYRMVRPSGGESWLRDAVRALPEKDGGWIVGTLVSVGLERSFRAQIAALEGRIWESQRLESLGALSGSVAHDFNNLLTTILSSAQLIESQIGSQREVRRDVRLIQDAARRGAALVRQILHFASRRQDDDVGAVDVNAMVGGLEPILRRRIGLEVALEVRPGAALPSTVGDAAQLEQVLLNLVVNAREATPDGGVIAIDTGLEHVDEPILVEGDPQPLAAGAYVRFSVRDTGPGIPLEARTRIFEPFFSTKRAHGGSGLGLSTVQRIVRAQGGGIRVESSPGKGSAFHVYLPASPAEAPAEVRAATLAAPRDGARILVVEDDEAVRPLLVRLLERDGHAVVAVESAAEAIRAFDRTRPPFDVLLVDIVLADRPGPDLVKALRRRGPPLAVVYVSGYGEEGAQRHGAAGDDVFLAKPFAATDLRDAVARALERGRDSGRQGRVGRA